MTFFPLSLKALAILMIAALAGVAVALATALSIVQMLQYWMHVWPTRDITWDQYRSLFLTFQ